MGRFSSLLFQRKVTKHTFGGCGGGCATTPTRPLDDPQLLHPLPEMSNTGAVTSLSGGAPAFLLPADVPC